MWRNGNGVSKIFLLFFCMVSEYLFSQERITTLGFQIKPMVPSRFFGTGPLSLEGDSLQATFTNKTGWSAGMVIRKGLTKMWSIESGISMMQRNYQLDFFSQRFDQGGKTQYRFIGYEIPLQALVYVQLGKQVYMNSSAGVSCNFYPSNLLKQGFVQKDTSVVDYSIRTYRARWNQVSVIINYGFEYRSKKSGYYYIGASFHRPFGRIAGSQGLVESTSGSERLWLSLSGSYFSIDLKYFLFDKYKTKKAVIE